MDVDVYISRNRVLAEIAEIGGHWHSDWETAGVLSLIARQPIADVGARVRCEDCVSSEGLVCKNKRSCQVLMLFCVIHHFDISFFFHIYCFFANLYSSP